MTEAIIDKPTYLEHIRHFFTDGDLDHMSQRGHDLSTYQGVRKAPSASRSSLRRRTPRCRRRKPVGHGAPSAISLS